MRTLNLLSACIIVFLCSTVALAAVRPSTKSMVSPTCKNEVPRKTSNFAQTNVPGDNATDRTRVSQRSAQTASFHRSELGHAVQGSHVGSTLPLVTPSAIISPAAPPPVVYDEQLGQSFTQDFSGLDYNVTAVEQADVNGYGPAYLLNGLSSDGYWYQVGLCWNWPYLVGGYESGFALIYEVFNSSGSSVFPSLNSSGLDDFSGVVTQGDTVHLSLHFSAGNVTLYGYDYNSAASAQENYSAEGATDFSGTPHASSNSNGFFTGLMTEWYHVSEYFGNEAAVHYSNSTFALSSAWMWIDEFNSNNRATLFSTSNPVTYSNPTQLQYFSSNGATEASDAYDFITGTMNLVPITLSYSVIGGGVGYGPPTLTYFFGGARYVTALTTSPTTYYVDPNSTWNAANLLPGSSSTETWCSNQQTSNSANSSQTVNILYFHQYLVELEYSVLGTGTGYSPPNVTIEQFGTANTVAPPTSAFVDAGSDCLYLNPLLGSNSTRWWKSPITNATVLSPTTIIRTYYLQYNFTGSYSTSGGSGQHAPSLHGTQFGAAYAAALTTTPTSYWLDSGTYWSIDNVLFGSGNSERWITTTTVASGTVSSSNTLNPIYYHQYSLNVYTSLVGSASGYSLPQFEFTCNSSAQVVILSQNPQTVWGDNGASWSISPDPLAGSNSSVRWDSQSALSGTIAGAVTIDPTFYVQYDSQVDYQLLDGGPASAPTLTYRQCGGLQQLILTATIQHVWIDSGSPWSATNPLAGSNSSERWQAPAASGTFSSSAMTIISYYNQWNLTAYYSLVGGGSPGPPSLNYTLYGTSGQTYTMTQNPTSIWADAGSLWTIGPNPLDSSSPKERWDTQSQLSGTVSTASTTNLSIMFTHQFYLDVESNSAAGGSISPTSDWFEADQQVRISAVPSSGWQFENWEGSGSASYSGALNSTTIVISSPTVEYATFYPGITISAGSHGTITYSYKSGSGSIPSASSRVLFVPLNANVSLAANPSFYLFRFRQWSNAKNPTAHQIQITVTAPTTLRANFDFDWINISVTILVIAMILGVITILILRRRKTSLNDPAADQEQPTAPAT